MDDIILISTLFQLPRWPLYVIKITTAVTSGPTDVAQNRKHAIFSVLATVGPVGKVGAVHAHFVRRLANEVFWRAGLTHSAHSCR